MKKLKLIVAVLLTFAMTAVMFAGLGGKTVQAASKPGKPVISLTAGKDGTSVTVIIKKTEGAKGYYIYMKAATDKKFKKVKTLKKNGTAERSITITDLEAGEYSFKVKAYAKNGKKTVKGSFGKAKSVTLVSAASVKRETIKFGSFDYEYDMYRDESSEYPLYRGDGKKEELEWEVLDYSEDGKKALIVSKYIISIKAYSNSTGHIWENSALRKWLNEDFINNAFTDKEKARILETKVENHDFETYAEGCPVTIPAGNDTVDKIFILSFDEVDKYFSDVDTSVDEWDSIREDRMCYCYGSDEASGWWLRTPSNYDDHFVSCINSGGYLYSDGGVLGNPNYWPTGVRPAMWITVK